jgi:hypothetical protein
MLGGEGDEGQQVGLGIDEQLGCSRELLFQLVEHPVELGSDLDGVGLGEERAHQGRHHGPGCFGAPGSTGS